jgi:hypothetical protein
LINGDAILPVGAPQRTPGGDIGFRPRAQLAQQIRRDPIDLGKLVPADVRGKPREVVDLLTHRFFQTRPAQKEIDSFVQYLESRSSETTDATLRELIHLMMSTPQFQLT